MDAHEVDRLVDRITDQAFPGLVFPRRQSAWWFIIYFPYIICLKNGTSIGFQGRHPCRKWEYGLKTGSMDQARAMYFQAGKMGGRRVSFVAGKAIFGIAAIQCTHEVIPGFFGKNRCGCNGEGALVSFYQGGLGNV